MEETSTSDGTRQTPLTRALATIRTLRQRLDEQEGNQPVAVVGIGLRLPGGIDDLDGYWEALTAGRDLVRPMPEHRKEPFAAEWEGLPQRGGFLDEVLEFDAGFFGISPREARHLDPQHRLLLEVSWEALEDAGLPADRLPGTRAGLYLGIMWQDYREWLAGDPDAYWTTGNGHNFAAGRIAYALGLTGPAVAIDTACSSSLVAVHLAVQALRRGECDIAFAAGANLIMSPRSMRLVRETRSLAPDGLCKAFDARANGFTRGEGSGAVVLKRLDHALRDGDRVHAVIHGTAVNQDGRSGGFTAPNVLAQVALIERALAEAQLEPADIGHVESHGTGTALGDPIEMEALATALGRRNGGAPLPVGAVKTNLGHLESAAGIAGLAKAVLCLRHRKVPPVLHFRTLNPRIDLSGTGITVPNELSDWSASSGRYAGVSSFGMSGTNAHVILGGAPEEAAAPTVPVDGFEITAKTPEALRALAARYADRAAGLDPADYPAFAHTATSGRTRHEVRARITADNPRAAAEALRALAAGDAPPAVPPGGGPDPAESLPRRVISLPAYPWQRQRHAPEQPPAAPQTAAPQTAAPQPGTAQPGTARPGPEERPAEPVPAHRLHWVDAVPTRPDPTGSLILAGDDQELLERLVSEASAQGLRGTSLAPAPLEPAPGWQYEALPTDADAWRRFWAGRDTAGTAALVLAMKASPLPDHADPGGDPVPAGAALCAAVTQAARSLADACGPHHRAFAVTRAARHVQEGDRVAATDHGLLHGLAPVLGLELGTSWGGIVDLPPTPTAEDVRALLSWVAGQPPTGGPEPVEDLAAVRGGVPRVARLTAVERYAPRLTVRQDATYLVTGALGAVGRELVTELVRRGARHLLLIGRRERDRLDPDASALLDRLDAQGVRVAYRGGGCDTPAALAAACTALDGMPAVRGVVHAAGTLRRTPVARLGVEDFADALGAKSAGAWWLHLAARDWPLDFFVLVSSVSALWGTEGCAAYSAANGALDALAAHRASLGLPAVSIAYGPWELDGAGMADAELRDRSARLGVGALTPVAGRTALTGQAPEADGHLVVCPLDLPRLRRVMAGLRHRGLFAEGFGSGAAEAPEREPSIAAQLAALPERVRARAARDQVARLLAAQLGHSGADDVREDVGFFDLGLDSIMAVDLVQRLSEAFEVTLQAADVFDHPTVAQLADHLLTCPATTPAPTSVPATTPAPASTPVPTSAPATRTRHSAQPPPQEDCEPIAIIGMAGRFPQADSVEELWQLLREGRDGVTAVPPDRWDTASLSGRVVTDQGGFLRDIDRFDAAFFSVPAREAQNLDPQQRLLLESTWHALEDAGIDPRALRDSATGVFVGVSYGDYARLLAQGGAEHIDAYYSTGTALNAAAGRIAYTLGLNGPAVAVDTACSSSLVALHLAVRSLRSGETDAVLAGGVNVLLDPMSWVAVSQAHMLSPDGRCRTFSADANGFVRSEGCGVLVLKRLSDARRDGDRVYAVIRGSAVNQDGASSGLTAPSGSAQEAMLAAALADARTEASEVSYLEAHGTGTSLGDPVELGAAWRVLGAGRRPGEPLHVGSVKSNIGHCESAAGMAAVIKTVLALRHDLLPADLHFKQPNPHVDWAGMNVRVVDTATPWRYGGRPRVAGVSGFGFTGTNAHLVLADAPDAAPAPTDPAPADPAPATHLVPLSAPDPEGLERLAAAWEQRLEGAVEEDLAPLAATAAVGRAHFRHRRALLGRTPEQLLTALRTSAPSQGVTGAPRIAFLFSGQGSQYFGMGRELYETEPVFREVFDTCDRILAPSLGASLADLIHHGADKAAINETWLTQPALVALETALAALWESWGVTPAVVMGHSVGEIAAVMHAGVVDLPTGLGLIAERARLMQGTERGAMLAVVAAEERVAGWIEGRALDIAAVNGPESVVVSGAPGEVDTLAADLTARGVRNRRLSVSHAFHSRLLEPVLGEFAAALAPLEFRTPEIPVISNVTGRLAGPGEYDADYWCRHARLPVRFHDGARRLSELSVDYCLEIGPDRTLVNLLHGGGLTPAGGAASSLRRGTGDRVALLTAAQTLYLGGQDLDWRQLHQAHPSSRGDAPRYPFARTRHWTPVLPRPAAGGAAAAASGPAWGTELRSPALRGRAWTTERSTEYPAHLTDHRLYGTVSVPGASQTATVLSALGADGGHVVLEDLYFPRALVLREGERYEVQILDAEQEHGGRTVSVQSLLDPERGRWQEHLVARIAAPGTAEHPAPPDTGAFVASADRHLSGEDFYRHLRALGYHLGPSFRWIGDAWIRGDEALIRYVQPADPKEDPADYRIHPGLLDSCLQSAVAFAVGADGGTAEEEPALAIPFAIARLSLPARPVPTGEPRPTGELWGHIRAVRHDRRSDGLLQVDSADLHMFDASGATTVAVDGFRFRRAPRSLLESSLREGVRNAYDLSWAEQKPPTPARAVPLTARRITLLGGATEVGRAVRTACEALGHRVTASGAAPEGAADADLVVDARFAEATGSAAGATAEDALTAVLALADTLRAVGRDLPYAVLGTGGEPGSDPTAPVREALWGMAASLEAEQPDRRLLRLTLAPGWAPALLAETLTRSLDEGIPETRLEIGAGAVRAARLTRCGDDAGQPANGGGHGGAVLITGGIGALGLSTAGFLARQGARSITLMARSAPDEAARSVIDGLIAGGTRVRVVRGDVTDPEDCRRAVAEAGQDLPLRTVLHLAGATDDHAFDHLVPESFAKVFAAKARGAVNLAAALDGCTLDALLLFSSASAVLGSAGQANYAAANGFLAGLARTLRAGGTPATSIDWGPWTPHAAGGMAASAATERAIAGLGLRSLTDEEAEELLRLAFTGGRERLVAVAVSPDRYLARLAGHPRAALLEQVADRPARPAAEPAAPVGLPRGWLRDRLSELAPEDRDDLLRTAVREAAGDVLGNRDAIDDDLGFTDVGLDSIMVIDLRTRLSHALAAELPATVALDHPTVAQLSAYAAALLLPERPTEPSATAEPPADAEPPVTAEPPADAEIEAMSFDELVQAVQADVALQADAAAEK
ncbi:SDR family NAD(P)-dependent oxidoreductase [Peterkaempfera bronchialis]|uniref:SDR family NAD(P)-dependent oxidoreductase n=1 Tax=Peterkaempfera bronchialis TaxID=2126346 RepID=UPI003C2E8DBE